MRYGRDRYRVAAFRASSRVLYSHLQRVQAWRTTQPYQEPPIARAQDEAEAG